MTRRMTNAARAALLALAGVALLALAACTDEEPANADGDDGSPAGGGLTVTDVWARATAGNPDENTAIYATITNASGEADTLVSASVAGDIAERAELHEVVQEGGAMVMREIEGGIPVPASGPAVLEPGANHVMLLNVQEQLSPGQTFMATLTFEHAGNVEVEVEVREVSTMGGN